MLELLASVFHILEQVEGGTAGAEQDGHARLCHLIAGLDTILHGVSVANGNAQCIEIVV